MEEAVEVDEEAGDASVFVESRKGRMLTSPDCRAEHIRCLSRPPFVRRHPSTSL